MEQETRDRPVRFDSGGRVVAGMLHLPAGDLRQPGFVFCNAFGDERKASALAMARLARCVAASGRAALRFDYWGCGDSPGDFMDASLRTRLEDIRAAADFLLRETGALAACLVGLRLGATLAVRACADIRTCSTLVLIEPVQDAAGYLDGLLRRRIVRRMITSKRGTGAADAGRGEVVDLDGYAMRAETLAQMRSLHIRVREVSFFGPVLLVQVSFNERLRPETGAVRDALEAAGASLTLRSIVMPPFWSRIDVTDTACLNEVVLGWLKVLPGI